MTISSTINRVSYAGNGSTTSFSFPYRFLLNSDLVVISKNNSTGVETILVLNTGYTVSGAGSPAGGSVTITPAPATGTTVIIYRDPAIKQEVDFLDNDKLPAEVLEGALDRATMVSQRLSDRIGRALVLPEGFTGTFDPKLPSTLTPDATIAISPTGDKLVMGPSATDVANAQGYANAAASSASAAAGSAAAAAASAAASASVASDLATETANRISADASHASTASGIHGVTGALVGTSDAQTLSAKTFADPVSLTEVATPAAPTPGVRKLYAKSGKIYHMGSDGLEQAVGAGSAGGVNYISNPDAESSTLGWTTYADAAGAAPVDGVGGTPSATWTRVTASPLRGSASFLFTKGAVNRQGDGASFAFSVDAADKAKVLQISFDYAIDSGTFADGDLTVWIYDVTNASLTQPAPFRILNASAGLASKWSGAFQTASNSTSYRLIIHCSSTSSAAYAVKFDNFSIGQQQAIVSPTGPVGEIIATGSVTPPVGFLYADGSAISRTQYSDLFAVIGTTYGAGDGSTTFNLPNLKGVFARGAGSQTIGGITYSATLGSSQGDQMQGHKHNASDTSNWVGAAFSGSTASGYSASVTTPTDKQMRTSSPIDDGSNGTPRTGAETRPANVAVAYHIRYLSNLVYSSDTDTRVVAMHCGKTGGSHTSSGSELDITNFDTVTFDTHGAFNTTTGVYTVPVSGIYSVSMALGFVNNTSGVRYIIIQKNGVTYALPNLMNGVSGSDTVLNGTALISCVAGDTIKTKAFQNSGGTLGYAGAGAENFLSINRISGPSQIAQSESVNAKYNTSAAQSIANTGEPIVDFGTKVYDSHGAVTTGASWKFTAPISGKYSVRAACHFNNANWGASTLQSLRVYKNGSADDYIYWQEIQASMTSRQISVRGSTTVQLNAGEYIDVRISQNDSGSRSLSSATNDNYVVIERVGNF